MKTIEELYKEVIGNDGLKEKFITATKEGSLADFLKEHECDADVKDVMTFVNGVKESAVSDDDLDKVAGGCCTSVTCGCEPPTKVCH